jgi:hypothetical protein
VADALLFFAGDNLAQLVGASSSDLADSSLSSSLRALVAGTASEKRIADMLQMKRLLLWARAADDVAHAGFQGQKCASSTCRMGLLRDCSSA